MSTHAIEIVELGLIDSHPNADRLCVTRIWGWQCCIGRGQFRCGDKAIYIPPDFCVPLDRQLFAFLRKEGHPREFERIRVRKFRGLISQGLLIEVPVELKSLPVGADVMEQLGVKRYDPPINMSSSGEFIGAPSALLIPKFDVENFQRYENLFEIGEEVVVTEKIHGANARYVYANNRDGEKTQFCGSRVNWFKEDSKNIWWQAFNQCPGISKWCHIHPGQVLYGEVFGPVQSLKYGAKGNEIFFAAFAILSLGNYLSFRNFSQSTAECGVPIAPIVYCGSFDLGVIAPLAEEDSAWPGAKHMCEGVVILPVNERLDDEIGRVILKIVGNRYLEKSK